MTTLPNIRAIRPRLATHALATLFGAAIAGGVVATRRGTPPAEHGAPAASGHAATAESTARRPPAPGRPGDRPDAATHARGWAAMQLLPRDQRDAVSKALLESWIEVDPEAALRAFMDSLDGPLNVEILALSGTLDFLMPIFEQDPMWFLDKVGGNEFGLKTESLRRWWIQRMAVSHPEELLASASAFGPLSQAMIFSRLIGGSENQPELFGQIVDALAALPPGSRSEYVRRTAAAELGVDSPLAWLELRNEAAHPNTRAFHEAALSAALARGSYEETGAAYDAMTPAERQRFARDIAGGRAANAGALRSAIEELLHEPDWPDLARAAAINLHNRNASGDDLRLQVQWAELLPERADTEDLFRTAVRPFVSYQHEQAREWIGTLEPGWKRDNALAAYVQTALAARNDVQAADWAMQRITDPRFQAATREFYQAHEIRQAATPQR